MVFKILMGNYFYLEIIREALNLFSLSSRNYWSNSSTQMTELKKKKRKDGKDMAIRSQEFNTMNKEWNVQVQIYIAGLVGSHLI